MAINLASKRPGSDMLCDKYHGVSWLLSKKQGVRLQFIQHPLKQGQVFQSLGGHFAYRVVGPCCRLFDREELPWPCCRIQWHSKEPSWRRVGKQFVLDVATRNSPSYAVEVLGQESSGRAFVITLYAVKLPQPLKEWWYSPRSPQAILPPLPASASAP